MTRRSTPRRSRTTRRDVKPFLAPFDALVASSSVGGDLTSSKVIITVK